MAVLFTIVGGNCSLPSFLPIVLAPSEFFWYSIVCIKDMEGKVRKLKVKTRQPICYGSEINTMHTGAYTMSS